MTASFSKKRLEVTITLGTGSFGQTGANTVKLAGKRMVVSISKAGSPSFDSASARIYGVTPTVMNAVSTLGVPFAMVRLENTMTISAGDDAGMAVVYQGAIANAWQTLDGAPDTFLNVTGIGALQGAIVPVPPTSYPGGADVALIMASLANQLGYAFENSGVTTQISSPYLAGTAIDQVMALARAANIEAYIDTGAAPNTLAIWPKDRTRGGQIPLIDANSGLIGWPQYNDAGMGFKCLFNPNIRIGGQIQMKSEIGGVAAPASGATQAQAQQAGPNGTWYVRGPLTYELSSEMPNGPWFCDVMCSRTVGP